MIDQYADKYAETGGAMYKVKVLQEAESYVNHIVNKINVPTGVTYDYDELRQEGRLMVIKALENYEASRDNKFSTYMYIRVYGAIKDYMRNQGPLSRGVRRLIGEVRGARRELAQILGRHPSDFEIAEALDVSVEKIRDLMITEKYRDQQQLDQGGYQHNYSKLKFHDPFKDKHDHEYDKKRVMSKLKTLPVRDRVILICEYYLDMEAKETAKLLGYANRSYIYNLKRKILDHLQTLVGRRD